MYRILFTRPTDCHDLFLATRLTEILYGSQFRTILAESDGKWNLGGQNDWWLRFHENGNCAVTNRGGFSAETMDALALVLREFAGLRDARSVPV